MHVGYSVDALSPQLTGIGRYCWEIGTRLPSLPMVDQISYWRGTNRLDRIDDLIIQRHPSRFRSFKRHFDKLFQTIERSSAPTLASERIDVFHGPNFMLPDWVDRGVVTIHDLSIFHYPDMHPPQRVALFERQFESSLRRADHVITDCEYIRGEVIRFSSLDHKSVTVVPLGVGLEFKSLAAEQRNPVLRRLGLPTGGYGLTVSSLEPRKRIDRLIEAWRELPSSLRNRFPLVIAGASGWNNAALRLQIQKAASEGWLMALDFIEEKDLPAVYSGASLFAYPSLYEGFGLPPIEAMACGVPAIVANSSCLPEVTRGAAMLVEPEDIQTFATAIERAIVDQPWRMGAISAGIQVASSYTWANCVEQTVEVYKRAVAE